MARRKSKRLATRFNRYGGASDVRGLSALEQVAALPAVPVAIGFGLLVFLYLNRDSISSAASQAVNAGSNLLGDAFDFARAAAFKAALPGGVSQYSTQILSSAQRFSVDPWALAAIMYNESRGGLASGYKPQGAAGTGDFIPRWTGSYVKYANPNTGLPADGQGWGRGLMQIDYGVHNAWVIANPWWDAQTNIDKGAELLRWNLDYFRRTPGAPIAIEAWRLNTGKPEYGIKPWAQKYPRSTPWPTSVRDVRPLSGPALYEAAIAAYNVSYPAVLQALGLGLPAEAGTSRQDYVSKFMALVSGWRSVAGF